ncbi:uncharacterized protein LOC130656629 isoform X2 [Hydractinia symbiolongicarpus]|uniref:uncharacterized protein LOC130656629 isoform X2 n=1 Tax=Hydractinia symbiolongicarpus TaxID=13093 RepID=UPI00254C0F5E|nr:uncharacterized protein LOC130656629 isoform X2 [Hydractinia symbiolongicarpus]
MSFEKPVCVADIEAIARKNLTRNALNYYVSGADGEQTLSENCKAFDRLRIRPRLLRGLNQVDMTCHTQNKQFKIPICIAPSAMQKMAHPIGEIGTALAAESFGTCMGVSTLSTTSYEEIAKAAPNCHLWMQLYVYKKKQLSVDLIRRAEKAGFTAIVLTVDTPELGKRLADERHKFSLPSDLELANFKGVPGISDVSSKGGSGLMAYCSKNMERALGWDDVDWLRTVTKLPILLKGILTREDALEALKHDVQGIIVSNHGGRQLDGVPSTIEALPEVVQAVDGKMEVYLDGGIRKGTDVFKALALGAKAVFIGRPALYGLSYNGEKGVKKVLELLQEELEKAMLLAGCASLADITPDMVVHESYYRKLPNHKL